jgi:hypothetical protein
MFCLRPGIVNASPLLCRVTEARAADCSDDQFDCGPPGAGKLPPILRQAWRGSAMSSKSTWSKFQLSMCLGRGRAANLTHSPR